MTILQAKLKKPVSESPTSDMSSKNESETSNDWIMLDNNEKKRQASEQSGKSSGTGNMSNSSDVSNNNALNNTASLINDASEEAISVGEEIDSASQSFDDGSSEVTSSVDDVGTSV